MKKRIFAALLALCLTVLTGCDWSDNTDDIFGTLTDYYNVENKDKDKDVKLTSFALPYLKGETADPITCPDGAQLTLGTLLYEGLFALDGQFEAQPALAESYTYDASRYTYTITLRAASFSDGTSVTARDVVNALRRAVLRRSGCGHTPDHAGVSGFAMAVCPGPGPWPAVYDRRGIQSGVPGGAGLWRAFRYRRVPEFQ